jgi:hypothetical protein
MGFQMMMISLISISIFSVILLLHGAFTVCLLIFSLFCFLKHKFEGESFFDYLLDDIVDLEDVYILGDDSFACSDHFSTLHFILHY